MRNVSARLDQIEKRLAPLAEAPTFWVNDGATVRNCQTGEQLSPTDFARRYPDVRRFTINIGDLGDFGDREVH